MDKKTQTKTAGFIALIVLYFLVAGSDVTSRMIWRYMLVFVVGVSVAFWAGSEPVGILRPISWRPVYILIGVVMMIYAITMTAFVKEGIHKNDRPPNKAAQATPGSGFNSADRFTSTSPAWLSLGR